MRIVVLVSGSGTNLQALLDAAADGRLNTDIAAVLADKPCRGIERAEQSGVPTRIIAPADHADRPAWNRTLEEAVAEHAPDLVVFAGFMRIVDPQFVRRFDGRIVNTHPALLPSFPGMHGPRDALRAGVKVAGATVFVVDPGIDTGRILLQGAVDVLADDDVDSLHERIKEQERPLLIEAIRGLAASGSAESSAAERA